MWRRRPTVADQLSQYWDERDTGQPRVTPVKPDLDPTLIDTIEGLHARDDARLPDPRFIHRLERTLTEAITSTPALAPAFPSTGIPTTVAPRPNSRLGHRSALQEAAAGRRWPVGHLATAALITLMLITSFAAFGPGRPRRPEALPAVIPAMGASTTPDPAQRQAVAEFLWETTGGPDLPLNNPGALAVDGDGNLWVADRARNAFQIFSPDGVFQGVWGEAGSGEGQFRFYNGDWTGGAVAFDRAGNLFVADPGNHRVQKFGPDRSFLMTWGTEGKGAGQFIVPASIAVDDEGRVYVADSQRSDIQVFDGDGQYLHAIGSFGLGEGELFLAAGGSVTVDLAGNVWVTNIGSQRIDKFAPDGTFLATFGSYGLTEETLTMPRQAAVDADDRLFVAAGENPRVLVYGSDGSVIASWGAHGSGPGEFRKVQGIVLDGRGNVYVGDSADDRVQKFRLLPPLLSELPLT
jgi:DNA-binding beta-propeller fold protein YncE